MSIAMFFRLKYPQRLYADVPPKAGHDIVRPLMQIKET